MQKIKKIAKMGKTQLVAQNRNTLKCFSKPTKTQTNLYS